MDHVQLSTQTLKHGGKAVVGWCCNDCHANWKTAWWKYQFSACCSPCVLMLGIIFLVSFIASLTKDRCNVVDEEAFVPWGYNYKYNENTCDTLGTYKLNDDGALSPCLTGCKYFAGGSVRKRMLRGGSSKYEYVEAITKCDGGYEQKPSYKNICDKNGKPKE